MATTKATHFGTCQLCGRGQKLPTGILSLHGYSVRWGYFQGTCPGSRHLPFEQSKDLIEGAIASAQDRLEKAVAFVAKLRQPSTDNKAWVNARFEGDYSLRAVSQWMKLEVTQSVEPNFPMFPIFTVTYTDDRHREPKQITKKVFQSYDGIKTLAQAVNTLNARYADSIERNDVRELTSYIRWQQNRIKNWKPQPLTALSPEGKAPAKPETILRKAKAAHNAKIATAKYAYSKLADTWHSTFFAACQQSGIVRDVEGGMRQFDALFHTFSNGPSNSSTVFNFVRKFMQSKLPQAVKDAMQPLHTQMLDLASQIAELKKTVPA